MNRKAELLADKVEPIDITRHNVVGLVDAMAQTAFQARNVGRAARIYEAMLRDRECGVILCLAGSLVSAGLRKVIHDLVAHNMADAIVSTGANIVDQDFFEALGFHHYVGDVRADDAVLREMAVDRIYDTYIDEDQLRVCDDTISQICGLLPKRPHSSREFIREMGRYLVDKGLGEGSIVRTAFEKDVPIFVPAFSDCSAGFGLVHHQWHYPNAHVSIDSAKDFLELTKIKLRSGETGLVMIGGGVPKNFAQDVVVAADILGKAVPMHKYAIQVTVADERDGGLSGSTLREASSWGKVALEQEQMVYSEATLAFPLIAGYAYHKQAHAGRTEKRFNTLLDRAMAPV